MNLMTVLSNRKDTLIEVGVNTPSVARSSSNILGCSGNQLGLGAVAHQIRSPPLASLSIQAELTAVIYKPCGSCAGYRCIPATLFYL